jgi:hypothetical protein
MVPGTADCLRSDLLETTLGQIEHINKDIDDANRIALAYKVIQASGSSSICRPTKRLVWSSRKPWGILSRR